MRNEHGQHLRKFTDAELRDAVRGGLDAIQMAKKFCCARQTVYKNARRLGLSLSGKRRSPHVFTDADDELVRSASRGLMTASAAATAIGVSADTLKRRAVLLGLHAERPSTADRPISVGHDKLLRRLREVHGEPARAG